MQLELDDPRIARLRANLMLGSPLGGTPMPKQPMQPTLTPAPVGPDITPQQKQPMPMPEQQQQNPLGGILGSLVGKRLRGMMNRRPSGSADISAPVRAANNAKFGTGVPKFKLPGFARGGKLDRHIGKPVIVGERGAEVIIPTAPATVIPNHQLRALSQGSQIQPAQVDAPQLTRPAPALTVTPGTTTASPALVSSDVHAELGVDPSLAPLIPTRPRMVSPNTPPVEMARGASGSNQLTRPRVADPMRNIENQIEYERAHPVQDSNGRWSWKAALANVGAGIAEQSRRGGTWQEMLASGAGSAIGGVIAPNADERRVQQSRVTQLEQSLAKHGLLRKQRLDLEGAEADNAYKRAQTDYLRTGKPAEAQAREINRQRGSVLSNLRLLKGTRLDVNNPSHLELLRRADDLGISMDVDSWNNAGSNLVSVEVVDADNPTQKRRVFFNKATGETQADAGQSGYVQPVNATTGMTSAQEGSDADRDAARVEAMRRARVSEGLGRERFTEQRRHNQVTEARTTQGGTRGGANPTDARRTRAAAAIGKLNTLLGKYETARTDKVRNAARRQIERQSSLINSEFGDLTDDDASGWRTSLKPRQAAGASSSGGGKYAGQRFSPQNLPAIRQRLGVSSDEEARRIVEAQGGIFQ